MEGYLSGLQGSLKLRGFTTELWEVGHGEKGVSLLYFKLKNLSHIENPLKNLFQLCEKNSPKLCGKKHYDRKKLH
jgi:hypothetical protein